MDDFALFSGFLSSPESIFRLFMAAICGGMLGWNRERHAKPAGLRTHMLVSLGAATFVVAGLEYMNSLPPEAPNFLEIDPFRIVSGIIGGIGFLGAGSIIEARGDVRGLTTAASIWVSAAAGTASGLGFYGLAIIAAVFALLTLGIVGVVERVLFDSKVREDT